jgi:L-lactate dehydrogenase complex protein LldG
MANSARTEILARVRHASRGAAAADIARELDKLGPAPASAVSGKTVGELFTAQVRENAGSIECVSGKSDAARAVARYLYERYRTRKLVAGNDPRLAAMPWRDGGVLPRFGAAIEGDLAGVSYAQLAVAETGSIVTLTGKSNPASNSLLVEDHLVLVDLEDLVATMDQAWQRINSLLKTSGRPRGINFVSGPSGTADIDMQLVMGAHGPRSWHVILIGEV